LGITPCSSVNNGHFRLVEKALGAFQIEL